MKIVQDETELEALYGRPLDAATVKVMDRVTPEYRPFIERSPFALLATVGPEGVDCSPRGDLAGFVRISDDRTLMIPDRRGNNRVDSLRNIVRDPRAALLFMLPGLGNTLRVNGRAVVCVEPDLLQSFSVEGKAPRSVVVLSIQEVYFQCARALVRSGLWDPARHLDAGDFPSAGQILAACSEGRVGGEDYDRAWPERARTTLW